MRSSWKNLYLYNQVKTKIVLRKCIIDLKVIGMRKFIYNGRLLNSYLVRSNMLGYKYGEFCSTRYTGTNKFRTNRKHNFIQRNGKIVSGNSASYSKK